MATVNNTVQFFLHDYPRTLFPLDLNLILIQNAHQEIQEFIYQKITARSERGFAFLAQTRVYASKPDFHLRRTVKLDPIAEFFIYDLIYRNRTSFRKIIIKNRQSFGYCFEKGKVCSMENSYHAFKEAVRGASTKYKFCTRFDIASYFNSIYHHDLVKCFRDATGSDEDADFLGKYLRQTNSGRSIDCLPQGLLPAKVLGNYFLTFIDNSMKVEAEVLLRFMDDFYLFSNNLNILISDFIQIQKLLGGKGLSVNPQKTELGTVKKVDISRKVDKIKIGLLKKRHYVIFVSGEETIHEEEIKRELNRKEKDYLLALLKNPEIEEEDAELVLALMRDSSGDVIEHIPNFLSRFAHLSKNIYYFCKYVKNKQLLATIVYDFLSRASNITEYQLFWLSKIAENQLAKTKLYGDILHLIYEHPNRSDITCARVLEIPESRFGMREMREEHLKTGASNWLSWSSAIGCRTEKKANRNHLLSYFANGSPMNSLIANCVKRL